MTRSLRLRLGLAAAGLIALALGLAGIGLVLIFDRVLDTRTAQDLGRTAKFVAGQVAFTPDGALVLGMEPSDARLATPYGGLYWQVEAPERQTLRSRSLWDKRLDPSAGSVSEGNLGVEDLAGPDGGRLIGVTLRVGIDRTKANVAGGEVPVVVTVALDRRELASSRMSYLSLLVPSLVALGIVLSMAMWLFVQRALAPFRALRDDLRAVHQGRATNLPARYPEEVQPLVDDLNRLIVAQERALSRARTQAGDMAHGLKTPLAVLGALVRRSSDQHPELSREIEEQALAMGRQVDRSLARARIATARGLGDRTCLVHPVVVRLVGALRRLPDAESLSWEVVVPAATVYPGDAGDLTELLGSLLDNARKWAHRRIVVTATAASLTIEDDGPGMDDDAIARVARGQRWDESKPGTGFGIAIAFDIVEEGNARLKLGRSGMGGLRVDLNWSGVAKVPDRGRIGAQGTHPAYAPPSSEGGIEGRDG